MENEIICPHCDDVEMDLIGGYTSQTDPHYFIEIYKCPNCGFESEVK